MADIASEADVRHVENCQFASWYRLFRKLTPKSRVLVAPPEFRAYLLEDGIHLPGGLDDESDAEEWQTPGMDDKIRELDTQNAQEAARPGARAGDEEPDSDSDDEDRAEIPLAFQHQIRDTIKELAGAVAPKLNWSAPRDATWILPTNNMKCINANDIYQLIKASDYCTHDLTQGLGSGRGPKELTLVLREWFDLNPALEFRCFVRDRRVVGISQRDMNYYEFLYELRDEIAARIDEFASQIAEKFPDASFVADVFVPRPYTRVWLIDINPWLERTDSLLYSWEQLRDWDLERLPRQLRLVEKHDSTRGFSSVQHSTNHVPHDLVDMDRENVAELVAKLKESYGQQRAEDANPPEAASGAGAAAAPVAEPATET